MIVLYPAVRNHFIKRDPINHLIYSSINSISHGYDLSFTTNASVKSRLDPVVNQLKSEGEIHFLIDPKSSQLAFYENISLMYQDEHLISFDMGYLDETGFIRSKELYKKTFKYEALDWSNRIAAYRREHAIDIKKALENKETYLSLIRNLLSGLEKGPMYEVISREGNTYLCDTLMITLDHNELLLFISELMETIKYDEGLKTSFPVLSEENWEQFATSLKDITPSFSLKLTIAIDQNYKIRLIDQDFQFDVISIHQILKVNAYGNEVKVKAFPDYDEYISIRQMIEEPNYALKVSRDVIKDGVLEFLNSKSLDDVLKNIEENMSPEISYEMYTVLEQVIFLLTLFTIGF